MRAAAFVVGPEDGPGIALAQLARQTGFAPVAPYIGLATAEAQSIETPLVFFLCAAVADIKVLKPMADAIRFSPHRGLRFAPLIYFAREPSREIIRTCINMGFDDVIALPFVAEQLVERIARQVDTPQIYYETSTYFGPDRHDRLETDEQDPRRGTGGQFRRFEIRRSADKGVDVLSDEMQVML